MTQTTSALNPDDECQVCWLRREQHGDAHHKFSEDGQLIPIQPGLAPKNTPPKPRQSQAGVELSNDPVARLQIRLIERLVAKELLGPEDLMVIFGADVENTRR